jgi:hypothetical protein
VEVQSRAEQREIRSELSWRVIVSYCDYEWL